MRCGHRTARFTKLLHPLFVRNNWRRIGAFDIYLSRDPVQAIFLGETSGYAGSHRPSSSVVF